VALPAVGTETAGALLVAVVDNAGRIQNEAARCEYLSYPTSTLSRVVAHLCGLGGPHLDWPAAGQQLLKAHLTP
jgi:hypothetical protein